MTPAEALSLAIFAINTILEPDASSDDDVRDLVGRGEEAVEILAQLRTSAEALEKVLPDRCSECGNVISSSHPSMENSDHAESCSLHVDEGLASERATRKARGDIGWEG